MFTLSETHTPLCKGQRATPTSGGLASSLAFNKTLPRFCSFIGDAFHFSFTPRQLLQNEIIPKNVRLRILSR